MKVWTERDSRVVMAAVVGMILPSSLLAQDTLGEDEWTYSIAASVWATRMDGTVGVDLDLVDVNIDLGDILDFTQLAGELRFEAIREWGYFGNIWWASLSDEDETRLGTVEADFDQFIAEAGGLYAFRPDLTGYFGLRYQRLEGEFILPVIGEITADESWVDAIVGIRFTPAFGNGWTGDLRADIGTGDSDVTWLAQVGFGYQFTPNWSANAAYRYLNTEFETGAFSWDLVQEGFGLGVVYLF